MTRTAFPATILTLRPRSGSSLPVCRQVRRQAAVCLTGILLAIAVPIAASAAVSPDEPCPASPAQDCVTYDDFDESKARPVGPGMNQITLSGFGWAIRTGDSYETSVGAALTAADELIRYIINQQKAHIEAKGYTVYSYTPDYVKEIADVSVSGGSMTAKVSFHGSTLFWYGNPSQ